MGLLDATKAAAKAAFAALGHLKVTVTYHHQMAMTYNATTGAVTRSERTQSLQAVLLNFARREIDGEVIRPTDRRALLLAADLSGAPALTDRLTIAGDTWEVVRVATDPATAVYDLQLRRP